MDEYEKFFSHPFSATALAGIPQQQRPEASEPRSAGRRIQVRRTHMPIGSYANHQALDDDAHHNPGPLKRPRPPRMEIPGSLRSREAQLRHGSPQSEDSGYESFFDVPGTSQAVYHRQPTLSPKKNASAKRNYDQKMTDKKQGKVPFAILNYLAILNAGKPLPVNRIYAFVREHFPGCITPGSDSWQKSIRENVAKYKKLFEKKSIDEVDNPDAGGKRNACYWAIRNHPETTMIFENLLSNFLNSKTRIVCETDMGMANPADWHAIVNGTKGLTPVYKERFWIEDVREPRVKRFRQAEEEADQPANALEQQPFEDEEYEQSGYDNQDYHYDRAQMSVSDVNQGLQYHNHPYDPYNGMGTRVENDPYDDVENYYRRVYDQQMLVSNAQSTANVNDNLRLQPSSSESGCSHRQEEESSQVVVSTHCRADAYDNLMQQQQLPQVKSERRGSTQSVSHRSPSPEEEIAQQDLHSNFEPLRNVAVKQELRPYETLTSLNMKEVSWEKDPSQLQSTSGAQEYPYMDANAYDPLAIEQFLNFDAIADGNGSSMYAAMML